VSVKSPIFSAQLVASIRTVSKLRLFYEQLVEIVIVAYKIPRKLFIHLRTVRSLELPSLLIHKNPENDPFGVD
jgi:hypothetical protein